MKLKLFENFQKDDTFIQEVKDCFQDLIDEGDVEIGDSDDWGDYDIVLHCILPTNEVETNSYDKFINQNKLYNDGLTSINNCVERLKQYSNYEFDLDFDYHTNDDATCSFFLQFKKGKSVRGDFYKIINGYVSIDYDDLRNLLKLPQSTEIKLYTGSVGKRIAIYFRTVERFEEQKDSLIQNIRKLEIDGEKFISKIDWNPSSFHSKGKLTDHQFGNSLDSYHRTLYRIEFSINPKIKIQ